MEHTVPISDAHFCYWLMYIPLVISGIPGTYFPRIEALMDAILTKLGVYVQCHRDLSMNRGNLESPDLPGAEMVIGRPEHDLPLSTT